LLILRGPVSPSQDSVLGSIVSYGRERLSHEDSTVLRLRP
jgi:hypothetical protein